MSDRNGGYSKLAKYAIPILVGIYFLVSLLTTPQVTREQLEAESQTAGVTVQESDAVVTEAATESMAASETSEAEASARMEEPASSAVSEGTSDREYSEVNGETIFAPSDEQQAALEKAEETVTEDGEYTSMSEVAAYIHLYGRLPSNYISKTKAKDQGWVQSEGNLQDVLPGKSIGGSRFYNDEGILPETGDRTYTECDIDYRGGKRNAKRIVFSDDGLVFYTEDHYETYIQLY